MHVLAGIFLATFIAEDLTAIGTGLLLHDGRVALLPAVLACAAGIWIGDLGLFALGRVAVRAGRLRLVSRFQGRLRGISLDRSGRWIDARLPTLIISSRLLPGTRLPLYVAAGATGVSLRRFAAWSLLAVGTWTPAIILLTAHFGSTVAERLGRVLGDGWPALAGAALGLAFGVRCTQLAATRLARSRPVRRIGERLTRARQWEFWPMWIFYAPVALWTVWLALRHGGYSTITAANPGIPDGGVVGESKYNIMRQLPRRWALPSIPVPSGDLANRLRSLLGGMRREGLAWPMILKPDVGQRGSGVRLARSLVEAQDYLAAVRAHVVAQPYHEGPYEAGVFYYRYPGEPRGRILSITDKHFPSVTGDGRSTLAELVRAHARYRMQAETFLTRLGPAAARVPADGEPVRLGIAGNHAQGTLFRDGRHLITPQLCERIDRIARSYEGFFVGRFDVRYSDVDDFKAGRDLAIVELNGATAESTDIYDPGNTLLRAYGRLFRQWSLVFAIGAANRAAGARVTSPSRLRALIREHLTTPAALPVAD
jgi:membrane protein DedA with SNARE-associated domain